MLPVFMEAVSLNLSVDFSADISWYLNVTLSMLAVFLRHFKKKNSMVECFLKRTTSVLFFFHRENPDKLSSRDNVHDLLSAGFIPLRLDQSKRDDNAFVELPRGFHPVHTSIEYKCASPLYRHSGSSRRTCLKSGRWSGRHVSCSPGAASLVTHRYNAGHINKSMSTL